MALLSKDYVILPVVSGATEKAQEVISKYRKVDGGVPWFAVLVMGILLVAIGTGGARSRYAGS